MKENLLSKLENDLLIWEACAARLVGVKHGLLIGQAVTEQLESASFLFVRGKTGLVTVDELPYRMESNFLFHVAADTRIVIEAKDAEVEYFIAAYHAAPLPGTGREIVGQILRRNPFHLSWGCRARDPAFFTAQFTRMADLWSEKTALSRMELTAVLHTVIHRFYDACISDSKHVPIVDTASYVSQYLQRNYADTVSLQKLADSLGITRSTLHEQFRRKYKVGPQQYLTQLRLDAARRALADSPMSIDEIAVSCGLRDKSYLSRVFKEKYDLSPSAFRTRAASNPERSTMKSIFPLHVYDGKRVKPVLVESMGRLHRFHGIPERVVCLDYSAAEMCAALGVADRIAGVASAESALIDCAEVYRPAIAKAPFLPAQTSNGLPTFSAVCACNPQLVIGTAYSFHRFGGIADAEEFERQGIHVYATKATHTLRCGFESVYEDLRNLGRIFGCESRAEALVTGMAEKKVRLARLAEKVAAPVRVFVFDAAVSDKPLTCGQSLEDHMIRAAGGVNVFGNRASLFTSVEWPEVAAADPEIILVHCFHTEGDGRQKIAFLKKVQEIASTAAIREGRFLPVGIKKIFPSVDCVDTALAWFSQFHSGF